MESKYYLINKEVLPSVFEKVVMAKKLLQNKKVKTVNEATKAVGISRSVFYKYKDNVSVFVEKTKQEILTMNLMLIDEIGVLSKILELFKKKNVSVLTINQNIPTEEIAPVSISVSTGEINCTVDSLVKSIKKIDGVLRVDLIAKE